MKTIFKVVAIAVFMLGATEVTAQKKMNPEKIMKFLDKNKDGKISLEEAKKARKKTLAENFTKIDKNEDGYIDLEELKAMKGKKD